MPLTPERRRQFDEALKRGTSMRSALSPQRKAQFDAALGKQQDTNKLTPEENNLGARFIRGVTKPAVDFGKFVAEAGHQVGRFATDPVFRKSVLGKELTPQESQKIAQAPTTKFIDPQDISTPENIAKTTIKRTAGAAAYAVPIGKGLSGVLGSGATSGFLSGVGQAEGDENLIGEGVKGAVIGAGTAGTLYGAGKLFSKGKEAIFSKAGDKLEDFGKEYPLRGIRPSQSKLRRFKKKTGMDLADFLDKEKVPYVEDDVIDIINKVDGELAKVSGEAGTIPTRKVQKAFKEARKDLTDNLKFTNDQEMALAKFLKEKEGEIVAKFGKRGLTGAQARRLKIATRPGDRAFDPGVLDKQKELGDVYRDILAEGTTGRTRELGIQSRNLKEYLKILESAPKGRGNLPLNLPRAATALIGSSVDGNAGKKLFGGILGVTMERIINNPKVVFAIAETSKSLGRALNEAELRGVLNASGVLSGVVSGAAVSGAVGTTRPKKKTTFKGLQSGTFGRGGY